MVAAKYHEETIYPLVEAGHLTIDSEGRIWLVSYWRGNRWGSQSLVTLREPRRAENQTGKDGYLQVRVMIDSVRYHAMAHRLVWRHFNGRPIPAGLTINHENGVKSDNRPGNLELATPAEQTAHAREVLKRGHLDQWGQRNSMTKLTTEQVGEVRRRRAEGELLRVLAAEFGVGETQISRIARGTRRSRG